MAVTLDAFRIGNFKAFADTQRVLLRPITLIYGANSAGKSSIIHALALAHHAAETGELDIQHTKIGGESIDLGGFRQYVHRGERERQVEIAFELYPSSLLGRAAELLRTARHVVVELGIGTGITAEQQTLFGDRDRVFEPGAGAHVERYSVTVDQRPLLTMSARRDGLLRLDRLDHAHPVFRQFFRALLEAFTTAEIHEDDFELLREVLDELVPTLIARTSGLFVLLEEEDSTQVGDRSSADTLVPISRGRRRQDLSGAARLFLPSALKELLAGLSRTLEAELRRLRYLGPLRSYPPRHLALVHHQDQNWFAGGGYAWDVVRTRDDIRRRVNSWLGDPRRLTTPYELEVRDFVPAEGISSELSPKLAGALSELAARLVLHLNSEEQSAEWISRIVREASEDVDPELATSADLESLIAASPEIEALVASIFDTDEKSEGWTRDIVASRSDSLQDLVLLDKRTGTPVSHRDVGIGISQVLPVLVSAYASTNSWISIEQPEIHLHPALQAELGDVFLESAMGERKNAYIIETHSEHLMLRILRRIRETTEGTLPSDILPLSPNDVSVLYVQSESGGSRVVHIPITPEGEFETKWPAGFFAERAKELF